MPNGGEDKHAKLRTAWNRLRRRHPTELEQFGPEPWDEETGKLTPEASAAYRKIAQPAPTPAAAPVTPLLLRLLLCPHLRPRLRASLHRALVFGKGYLQNQENKPAFSQTPKDWIVLLLKGCSAQRSRGKRDV